MSEDQGYHILLIEIVNNKHIKLFHARLDGHHLEVAGPTGTGKTTAISALWEILDPGEDRIHHGEKSSDVSVVLDDGNGHRIKAVRHYTPSGSTIKIIDSEANSLSAKEFKEMLSPLSSNPHMIDTMKNADQVKLLLMSANIPSEQIDALQADIDAKAKALSEAIATHKASSPGDEPEKADSIDSSELSAKIQEINDHNKKCADLETIATNKNRSLSDLGFEIGTTREELTETEDEILDLQAKLGAALANKTKIEAKIKTSEEAFGVLEKECIQARQEADAIKPIPQDKISELVAESTRVNAIASKHAEWAARVLKHEEASKALGLAQSAHKQAIKAKRDVLDGAKFPLPGLTIDDEGNMAYKGNLVANLGESEKTLVKASLAIEDALNRKIRAIRLDGIESMDKQDYNRIKDLASAKGIQILATRVSWDGSIEDNEITITDGYYSDKVEQEKE